MVLIIDGEIVADNDPRAIARRKPAAAPQRPAGGGMGGIHSAGGGGGGGGRAPPGGGGGAAGGSPLDALAAAIGIEGRVVTIPKLHARLPERQVPMIVAGIVGLLTMFMGWRVLAGAALMHCVAGFSETAPAAPAAARPPPGGGPR